MKDYKDYFKGKKITVMGLGLLGRGVGDAKFLAECGAELIVTDLKAAEQLQSSVDALKDFSNITFHLGGHRLEDFEGCDLVLKAAGVPLDSPYIAHARKHRVPVRMSADLFAELSGVPTVGVTGTRGKSTVSHMIYHILKVASGLNHSAGVVGRTGFQPVLGGNVRGVSTLALLSKITNETIAVLELDSWQLQGFGEAGMSPNIAVLTTFLPDHMNYYGDSMEKYFADKANIFLNQSESDTFVVGEQAAPALKEYGYQNKIKAHAIVAGVKDLPKGIVLRVPGEHNRYNAGIASVVARALGVDDDALVEALQTFPGVPGRLEFIREVRGVKYYNDTTATVPDATVVALRALGDEQSKHIVLIAGGSDKGLDMQPFVDEAKKYCKKILLLIGAGTDRIHPFFPSTMIYHSMSEAVRDAAAEASEGDVVLMSPAFASFGMFTNEFDRGEQFNTAVQSL